MYLHTLSPYAVEFGNGYGIRWYGLAYLAGFVLAYLFVRYLARRQLTPIKVEQVGDFIFCAAVGVIVGGRLGYCVFYDLTLLTKFTGDFPFWGLFELHHGGMASHGGILGLIVGCTVFARTRGYSALRMCDLTAAPGALGIFFGRIANFVNGELVGRQCDPSYPYAVKFPQDIFAWPFNEPSRLDSLTPVVRHFGLVSEYWRKVIVENPNGAVVENALQRIVNAVQRHDAKIIGALEPLLTPRYPSQLIAALLEGLAVFLVTAPLWRYRLKPGVVGSCFLIAYCTARITSEQFRMPDLQIGFQMWGLTRGQWLSIGMLVGSIVLAAFCTLRREAATDAFVPANAR